MMDFKSLSQKLLNLENLSIQESQNIMDSVMKGEVSEIQLSSILTALTIKKISSNELFGFVLAMRENCVKINRNFEQDIIDTCGTGGDGKGSVNVSTLTALTLASLGCLVAKHGNRSISSVVGSSDILQSLGYLIKSDSKIVHEELKEFGFSFLFAPYFHPSMKYAANVRKELGFRTIFNLLGPLTNPLSPDYQLIGVYDSKLLHLIMDVLILLNMKGAVVCHSNDGLDEFSIFEKTKYLIFKNGKKEEQEFDPTSLELEKLEPNQFYVKTQEEAKNLAIQILSGEKLAGTYAVALNAGVLLFLIGKVSSIYEGFDIALEQLSSGRVWGYFQKLLGKK